jgi:hypothetical protein
LHRKYDHLIWMKLSEIARYWAARTLTRIEKKESTVVFHAPFASPRFTVEVAGPGKGAPRLTLGTKPQPLTEVARPLQLRPGTWTRSKQGVIVCFDLPKGTSRLEV